MGRFNFIDFTENKYNRLLSALLVGLLVSPLIPRPSIVGFVVLLIPLVVMVVVINQLQPNSKISRMYLILAILIAFLLLLSNLGILPPRPHRVTIVAVRMGVVCFLALPMYLIARSIFLSQRVTADTIKGGICVYVLLGSLWTNLYEIVMVLDPLAFRFPRSLSASEVTELLQTGGMTELVYFSFMTLTTTGYGDITPSMALTRILASLEAIIGVMFPSIFIARLVGLYTHDRGKS